MPPLRTFAAALAASLALSTCAPPPPPVAPRLAIEDWPRRERAQATRLPPLPAGPSQDACGRACRRLQVLSPGAVGDVAECVSICQQRGTLAVANCLAEAADLDQALRCAP